MKTMKIIENELGYFPIWNESLKKAVAKFEARIKGKKGAPEKRKGFVKSVAKILSKGIAEIKFVPKEIRERNWKENQALNLAEKAGQKYGEHGYNSGDYMNTQGIDYVSPYHGSLEAPYCDMGGEGLGLVEVSRKRVYARSSTWGPSYNSTRYLIGKNEAGTYFAHPVPKNISSVYDAVQWIWNGHAEKIITRQGDIALIWGKGPKMPQLPLGHEIEGEVIVHESHPNLLLPKKGQRIIVGRRAVAQVSEATRD